MTTREITNQYAIDFPSEGQGMLLRDAGFAFVTNAVEEALAFHQNEGASVFVSLCKGGEHAFLETGIMYLEIADNGRGVDFDEFFQNGSPDVVRGNHLYRKGVVKALSKLDPNGGGRIVIVTKGKSGWVRYDGNFFGGEVTKETSSLGLSEEFNTYIFARIDEKENNLFEFKNFHEALRTKYHYYLTDSKKKLSLTWFAEPIEPLAFVQAEDDGYQKRTENFGNFTLEIERFLAPREGDETCQPHCKLMAGSGGVALYHENLFIQDAGFRCFFNRADAKEVYAQIRNAADQKSVAERKAILSEAAELAYQFWSGDTSHLPEEGIDLTDDFLDRLRFLVNIKPKNGFVLDMANTKNHFIWNDAFKKVLLAIDSTIGKEVRRYIQRERELAMKVTKGGCLVSKMNVLAGRPSGCFKGIIPPCQFDIRMDGVWRSIEDSNTEGKLPDVFVMYQAEEFSADKAEQMVRCHSTIVEAYRDRNSFALENGKTRLPSLCVVYYGPDMEEGVVDAFRNYKASLLARNELIDVRIIKLFYDENDDMDDWDDIEDIIEDIIVI